MNSYSVSRPGSQTTSSGYVGNPLIVSTVANPSGSRTLNVILQQDGDRKAPNPHVYDVTEEKHYHGRSLTYDIASGYFSESVGNRYFGLAPLPVPDNSAYLYNACVSKMYDKVRGTVDLAVEMSQAGQTLGLARGVKKVVTFAGDLYRSVKSRRPVGVIAEFLGRNPTRKFNRTKTAAELWLEYQYGWRPLVQTIYDCADQLFKPSLGDSWPLLVLKTRAGVHTPYQVNRVNPNWVPYRETLSGVISQRSELMVQWGIPPSRLLDYAKWTSFNPSGIIWENLPYSFVVDWLIDVGGWLRNLESAMIYHSAFVRGYYTTTMSSEFRSSINELRSDGFDSWEASYMSRSKNRAVVGNLFPRTPSFRPKLGPERLLSAAGLLAGFLGSPKRPTDPRGTVSYLGF
jgi:hypothetical protein